MYYFDSFLLYDAYDFSVIFPRDITHYVTVLNITSLAWRVRSVFDLLGLNWKIVEKLLCEIGMCKTTSRASGGEVVVIQLIRIRNTKYFQIIYTY